MSARYLLMFESHLSAINAMVTEVGNGEYNLIQLTDCEIKLELLEFTWNKICDAHDKLTGCKDIDMTYNYFKDAPYTKATNRYTTIKSALKRRANELEPRPVPLSPQNRTVQEHAAARTQLPTIQPPKFSGELLDWQSFKNKFWSVVTKDGVNEVDKMHYLLHSLHGDAFSLVANIEITDAAFATAWQILNTRYENKRILITAQLNKLYSISKMASRSAKEVNHIINTTTEVINALRLLGSPVDHWDHILVHFITQKLDPHTREDWEVNLGAATEFPSYERIKTFLLSRARALEAMEGRFPGKPRDSKVNKKAPGGNKPNHGPKSPAAHVHVANSSAQNNATSSGQNPCSCCGQAHFIVFCPAFRNLTADERHQRASSKSLCLNCLGTHPLENCRSKNRCCHCNAAHHSMLHDFKQLGVPSAKSNPTTLASLFSSSSAPGSQQGTGNTSL